MAENGDDKATIYWTELEQPAKVILKISLTVSFVFLTALLVATFIILAKFARKQPIFIWFAYVIYTLWIIAMMLTVM